MNLLFLLFGWLLLDFIGIITFIKPINKPRRWINLFNFNGLITLISILIELVGVILIIYSFSFPWTYQTILGNPHYVYYPFEFIINLDRLLTFFIYYAYYIGLIIIFIKMSVKKKIHIFSALEFMELVVIIMGIIVIFKTRPIHCTPSPIPEEFCVDYGYSSGYILFIIGLIILISNGLVISLYSRLKRHKNHGT